MSHPHRPRWSALAAAAALAMLALFRPPAAQAQCVQLDPPCTDDPPLIFVSPSAAFVTSPTLPVEVRFTDAVGMNLSSRAITLNGVSVFGSFSHSGTVNDAISTGTVTLASGNNTLVASVCDLWVCRQETVVFNYTAPAPPSPYNTPVLTMASHHESVLRVPPFETMASFATLPYVSRDVERAATLVYTAGQATGRGFVQVDATDNSTTPPQRMSITVKDAAGTVVAPEAFYQAGAGVNRLAARWSAPGLATGAYTYTVEVRSYWSDGTVRLATRVARVIILSQPGAPFGTGWTLAGLQRLRFRGDSVLIEEGDGSAVYFIKVGSAWLRPEGEFSNLTFDGTYYRRRYPDGTQAVFYSSGRLYYVRDRFDRQTTYEYTTDGNVSAIVDPAGKRLVFEYFGPPYVFLRYVTDPAGRRWSFGYNGSDLWNVWAPDGVVEWTGTYASGHLLRTRTARNGATWRFAHDAAGMVAADTLPAVAINGGAAQSPVVRARSWAAALLPAPGTGTSGAPAPRGVPGAIRAAAFTATGDSTRLAFDRYGAVVRVEGPIGDTTIIERNGHGQPTRVVDPGGTVRVYDWTGPALSVQVDEETEAITTVDYDTLYYVPRKRTVGGVTVDYVYGSRGELLTERVRTDSTIYRYDALYRLSWTQDGEGHRTDYTYLGSGSQNTASVTERNPDGTTRATSFAYDTLGRTTTVTEPGSMTRTRFYDLLNRDTASTDGRGGRTRFGWQGNFLSTVTDPAGKVYTFNRNVVGWVESMVDPNGRTLSYRYDLNGNLSGTTNRRGQAVSLVHDGVGRLLTRTAGGVTTTYGYGTPKNPWVSAINPESTDTVALDLRGRPVRRVSVMNGQRYTVTESYRKEGVRDQVGVAVGASSAVNIPYLYDNALRLTQITDAAGRWTKLAYNADGLPDTISYMSGARHTRTYTPTHLPWQVEWSNGAHAVTYEYDQHDRVVTRRAPGFVTSPGDSTRTFSYDADGQLLGFNDFRTTSQYICQDPFDLSSCGFVDVTSMVRQQPYTYDAAGNRTDNGATLQASSNRYATFGGYTMEYDLDGNLTRKYNTSAGFDQTYTWNALGQLTGVTTNGSTITYGYNGLGQRVRRTTGAGVVTRFVYDGEDLVLEVDGAGNKLRQYAYWPGVDEPHSVQVWAGGQNGKVFYYAADHPGSVMALFNENAQVVNFYQYGPWGEAGLVSETVAQPLRYMGRELDASTGLYYVRNRWYDVQQGRFVSEDPIGLNGGINLYSYALNSPTNLRDPSGLLPCRMYDVELVLHYEWDGKTHEETVTVPVASAGCKNGWGPVVGDRGSMAGAAARSGSVGSGALGGGSSGNPLVALLQTVLCPDQGYFDLNGSVGLGLGGTFGVMFSRDGVYVYGGAGLMTSPGASLTYSPGSAGSGTFVEAAGGMFGAVGQIGFGGDKYSGNSGYVGAGVGTPGASLTVFNAEQVSGGLCR